MYTVGYDPTKPKPPDLELMHTVENRYGFGYQQPIFDVENQWLVWCAKCGTKECVCESMLDVLMYNPGGNNREMVYGINTPVSWGAITKTEPYNFIGQALTFYGIIACDMATKGAQRELTDKLIRDLANTMAAGVVMSCLGEARYHASCVFHVPYAAAYEHRGDRTPEQVLDLMRGSRLGAWLQEIGQSTTRAKDESNKSRNGAVNVSIPGGDKIATLKRYAGIAKTVHGLHTRMFGDPGGIGGPLWWQGAKLAHDYLNGRIAPMVFVDQCFDLVHNGGTLTNKVYATTSVDSIILDWRANADLDDMLKVCPDHIRVQYGMKIRERVPSQWLPLSMVLRRKAQTEMHQLESSARAGYKAKLSVASLWPEDKVLDWWNGIAADDILVITPNKWKLVHSKSIFPEGYNLDSASAPRIEMTNISAYNHESSKTTTRYAVKLPADMAHIFHPNYGRDGYQFIVDKKDSDVRSKVLQQLSHHPVSLMFGSGPKLTAEQRKEWNLLDMRILTHTGCPMCRPSAPAGIHGSRNAYKATLSAAIEDRTLEGTEKVKATVFPSLPARSCWSNMSDCWCAFEIDACCKAGFHGYIKHDADCLAKVEDVNFGTAWKRVLTQWHQNNYSTKYDYLARNPIPRWDGEVEVEYDEEDEDSEDSEDYECDFGYPKEDCDWYQWENDECCHPQPTSCCHAVYHDMICDKWTCHCTECTEWVTEFKANQAIKNAADKAKCVELLAAHTTRLEAELDKPEGERDAAQLYHTRQSIDQLSKWTQKAAPGFFGYVESAFYCYINLNDMPDQYWIKHCTNMVMSEAAKAKADVQAAVDSLNSPGQFLYNTYMAQKAGYTTVPMPGDTMKPEYIEAAMEKIKSAAAWTAPISPASYVKPLKLDIEWEPTKEEAWAVIDSDTTDIDE